MNDKDDVSSVSPHAVKAEAEYQIMGDSQSVGHTPALVKLESDP